MISQSLNVEQGLIQAQRHAESLFDAIEERKLIQPGRMESEVNQAIYDLAFEMFGIRKYWHKRIVRAGANTLCPYRENPADLQIQADDIVFLDFGPVFEDWEADYGRTYVLGNDPDKLKLKADTARAFEAGKQYFREHQETITGTQLYNYACQLAKSAGWEFGSPIAGHLVGRFPHEKTQREKTTQYIRPGNDQPLSAPDALGQPRHWILELHFIDRKKQIGAFVEQLLTLD
jgi:Xaa-Pro dipeptidase